MPRREPLLLLILLIAACVQSAYDDLVQITFAAESSSSSSSTSGEPPDPTDGVHTVTGAPSDSSSSSSGASTFGSGSSSGEPALPAVVEVLFKPQPLQQAGTIAVEVVTVDATEATMELAGVSTPLVSLGENHFAGEIEVVSYLSNGTHTATITPAAGQQQGAPLAADYFVELPQGGLEGSWDASPELGKGIVRAIRVGPEHLYELGQRQEGAESRCYLRRRDFVGGYGDQDVVDVLAGKKCIPSDLAVAADGTVYLLMSVTIGDIPRWWLGQVTTWGDLQKIDEGEEGETATALALGPDGQIVACGHGPSPAQDLDARYWLRYPSMLGWSRSFDYKGIGKKEVHTFSDSISACAFRGDMLVMVGETFGRHEVAPLPPPKRKRLALLEVDLDAAEASWTVADTGPGLMTQSAGTALTLDDEGRAIVGLYSCGDVCSALVGEFRIFEPGGVLAEPPLVLGAGVSAPRALGWHPGGYLVLATGHATGGWSSEFFVQAYVPGEPLPLWTYVHPELAGLHFAQAVTTLPGVVVAGGIGGAGYPALAFLHG